MELLDDETILILELLDLPTEEWLISLLCLNFYTRYYYFVGYIKRPS